MPYSDSNPERRNLTVLSLSIIIYYAAGGCFDTNDGISFPLIKLHFYDYKMLVLFVWLALLWFWFKYFISNIQESQNEYVKKALITNMDNFVTRWFLNNTNESVLIEHLSIAKIYYIQDTDMWIMQFNGEKTFGTLTSDLTGKLGYLVKTLYMFKNVLRNKQVTDYYIPYLLFICAVGLGIYMKITSLLFG